MIVYSDALPTLAGEHLVSCLISGFPLAAIAFCGAQLLKRRGASARFALLFGALIAILVLFIFSPVASSVSAASRSFTPLAIPQWGALSMLAIWICGATFGLARIAVGVHQVLALKRRARQIGPAELDPSVTAIPAQQSGRRFKIRVSDELRVPAAVGFFAPAVLLPEWSLRELETADLTAVLQHEATHLRRWDDWTNLGQKMLKALLFFHPAVWWIDARLSLEREMACDDCVIANCDDPRSYAQSLVIVAEKSCLRRGVSLALAAVNRVKETTLRLASILDPARSSSSRGAKAYVAFAASALLAVLILAPEMPLPITFADASTQHLASTPAAEATSLHRVIAPADRPVSLRLQQPAALKPIYADLSTRDSGSKPKTATRRAIAHTRRTSPSVFYLVQTTEYDSPAGRLVTVRVWSVSARSAKAQQTVSDSI